MKPYVEMTKEELQALRKTLAAKYREFQGKDLKLDMSRGKPSVDQLDLSMGMMDVLSKQHPDRSLLPAAGGSEACHGAVCLVREVGQRG